MKKKLLIIFYLFIYLQTFSQSPYIPLDLNNTAWCKRNIEGGSQWCVYDEYYVPTTYTGFNGKVYKMVEVYRQRIDCSMYLIPEQLIYLRNDTVNRRVYQGYLGFTNEDLIYDFGLQVGDTVGLNINYAHGPRILGSIDSVYINSVWHRRFYFHDTSIIAPNEYDTIVEGIGTIYSNFFEGGEIMRSFCKDSQIIYQSDTGVYCYLPVSTSTVVEPNPNIYYAEGSIFIDKPFEEIEIINSMGSSVYKIKQIPNSRLDCSFLVPGIYYLRVKNSRRYYALKFLKE